MTGYTPDWSGTVETIITGGEVRRDVLLWNIGLCFSDHPVYLTGFAANWAARQLAPCEMSGGRGYEMTRNKGIEFQRWGWRPMKDEERSLHSVNGCPSCHDRLGTEANAEERAKVTGTCKDPQVGTTETALRVRWEEVGKFVKPALTNDVLRPLVEYMGRRRDATDNTVRFPHHQATEEQLAAFREEQAARNSRWFAIEDEGKRLATEVWNAAHRLAIGDLLGLSI